MSGIWYILRDADRYVYHYTRARTLTDIILPRRTLRLSRFQALNDPKETKNFRVAGAAWGEDLHPSVLDTFSHCLKENWRIACFSSDPGEAVFRAKDDLGAAQLQAMHERGHSRPRMWAQYAENHAGACLVFDREALDSAFNDLAADLGANVFSGKVIYDDTRVAPSLSLGPFTASMNDVRWFGVEEAARRHGLRFWRQLFLTKNVDWSAEREFRWLLYGAHKGEVLVNIAGCLRGVLLGSEFPTQLERKVRFQTATLGVDLARMDWNNGIPEIHTIVPLKVTDKFTPLQILSRAIRATWKTRGQ